jgi:hypothetical protein
MEREIVDGIKLNCGWLQEVVKVFIVLYLSLLANSWIICLTGWKNLVCRHQSNGDI